MKLNGNNFIRIIENSANECAMTRQIIKAASQRNRISGGDGGVRRDPARELSDKPRQ